MRQWFLHPGSVALIAAVAFAVRLGVGAWFESRLPPRQQFEFGDSDGYWYLGQQIAEGKPYEYRSPEARVFRMPGYPAVLAPIFLVLGPNASPMWGRGLSALLGSATAALVCWWGAILFDLRAGLIAGWIAAVYPGTVAMGSFILSEAPFMLLMTAQLAFASSAFMATTTHRSVPLSIATGIAAAGAIYMRPSWLLFLPFACVIGLICSTSRWRILAQSAVAMAVLVACLMPWWIRNFRITGRFIPTTLQVGISLKDGLNPHADGRSDLERVKLTVIDKTIPIEQREWTLDKSYRDDAVRWATSHPARVVQLAGIKFLRMWNVVPNEPMFRSWLMKAVVAITYTPLFLLGCYGLLRFSRLGWPYLLAALPALYFTLLHIVFVASIRYRDPAMLGMIVLASGAITTFLAGGTPDSRGNPQRPSTST